MTKSNPYITRNPSCVASIVPEAVTIRSKYQAGVARLFSDLVLRLEAHMYHLYGQIALDELLEGTHCSDSDTRKCHLLIGRLAPKLSQTHIPYQHDKLMEYIETVGGHFAEKK